MSISEVASGVKEIDPPEHQANDSVYLQSQLNFLKHRVKIFEEMLKKKKKTFATVSTADDTDTATSSLERDDVSAAGPQSETPPQSVPAPDAQSMGALGPATYNFFAPVTSSNFGPASKDFLMPRAAPPLLPPPSRWMHPVGPFAPTNWQCFQPPTPWAPLQPRLQLPFGPRPRWFQNPPPPSAVTSRANNKRKRPRSRRGGQNEQFKRYLKDQQQARGENGGNS
jgi:hypothetical protein